MAWRPTGTGLVIAGTAIGLPGDRRDAVLDGYERLVKDAEMRGRTGFTLIELLVVIRRSPGSSGTGTRCESAR
jgi:hypothetical protein